MMETANRRANRTVTQRGLFDDVPQPSATPSADKIRARLHEWLQTACGAQRMPWDTQHERKYAILFHQMAEWLPSAECDQLRAQFVRELERLRKVTPGRG